MEEQEMKFGWQEEEYALLAKEVQKELMAIIPYGATIEWNKYTGEWEPSINGLGGHIFILDDARRKYSLKINTTTVKNVVSVYCLADEEKLAAYVVTENRKTKEKEFVPLFMVTGDFEDVESYQDFMRIVGQQREPNKIINTRADAELKEAERQKRLEERKRKLEDDYAEIDTTELIEIWSKIEAINNNQEDSTAFMFQGMPYIYNSRITPMYFVNSKPAEWRDFVRVQNEISGVLRKRGIEITTDMRIPDELLKEIEETE